LTTVNTANVTIDLIDVLAHENFLEPVQIRLQALDPFPNESCSFWPWFLVMPDIQSEDLQCHSSNLTAIRKARAEPGVWAKISCSIEA
jgi:hypothetical protein